MYDNKVSVHSHGYCETLRLKIKLSDRYNFSGIIRKKKDFYK